MHDGLKPIAHRNGYPSDECHGGMREHCMGDAIGKTWEKRDPAYRDEHGRDTGQDLGMFGNEVPKSFVRPKRSVCQHWEIGLSIDNFNRDGMTWTGRTFTGCGSGCWNI